MPENRLVKLIMRLHDQTMEGRVPWEATANEGLYQCSFPEYVVQLDSRPSREEPWQRDFILRILNKDNDVIEEVTDLQLNKEFDEPYVAFRIMEAMYGAARRTALGTEAAIAALLEQLGGD